MMQTGKETMEYVMVYPGMLCVLIAGAVAGTLPAETVQLDFTDSVLVNDTTFTLQDIAHVKGDDGTPSPEVMSFVAGYSAPPSYTRYCSPEGLLPQLRAAFPGIRFICRGASRTVITTDFVEINIRDYQKAIDEYLDTAISWPKGEWEIAFPAKDYRVKVLNTPVVFSVSGLEENRFPKGSTMLAVGIQQGRRTFHVALPAKITVKTAVLVASGDILRGQQITAGDWTSSIVDITGFAPEPLYAAEQIEGKRAGRTIRAGTILHDRLFQTIPLIDKGDPVVIVKKCGRITITIAAVAREPGARGERIWVENRTTHKLVRVTVIARGKVAAINGEV